MPFNASGIFQRLFNWTNDRDASIRIRADRMDQEMDGMVQGINEIIDGTQPLRGTVNTINGTAANPAFSFADDTNTGIYRVSADVLGLSVNGSKVAEITTSGLNITGNITASGEFNADKLDGQHGSYYQNADNINAGTLSNARMREGLKETATIITDWDSAIKNGWYNATDATNAPEATAWFIGEVLAHNALWITQTVYRFTDDSETDTKVFRRECNDGSWGSWYRLRLSVVEQETVYRNAANLSSGVIPDARFEGARPTFGNLVGVKDPDSEDDFWLHADSDQFYILTDRDESGGWEGPHPAQFSNTASNLHVYGQKVWTAGNDGANSGLDADLLDGLQASQFLRSDTAGSINGNFTVNGASIYVGANISGAANSHVWFKDGTNANNYPFYYEHSGGRFNASGRNGVTGPLVIADQSGYARHANVFRSENTGGRMWLNMTNQVDFHWNAGFYYRIDNNAWVLINASPSDQNFKDRVDFKGHIFDEIKSVGVVRYTPKSDIPVSMPEGERDGFYAQELAKLDPNLVKEMPIPFDKEYKKDEDGNLVLDEEGNSIALPNDLDDKTFLSLSADAEIQLIAKLWRAVNELIARSEAKEDGEAILDETKTPTIEDIRGIALSKISNEHARFLRKLTGGASIEERDTWQTKAIACEAYLKGEASEIQIDMLNSEISMTGETIDVLAQTVMVKYSAYHKLIGLASGAKRQADAALYKANSAEEIEAILVQTNNTVQAMAQQWAQGIQS